MRKSIEDYIDFLLLKYQTSLNGIVVVPLFHADLQKSCLD